MLVTLAQPAEIKKKETDLVNKRTKTNFTEIDWAVRSGHALTSTSQTRLRKIQERAKDNVQSV